MDTPIEINATYSSSDGVPFSDPTLYHTNVGNLVYITITRPNITYVVHVAIQFVASLTTVHLPVFLHILRNLLGIVFWNLLLSSTSSLELHAYSNADYDNDHTNHKYITSFYIFLGDYLISWKSKNQPIVSLPSIEKRNIVLWHLLPKRLFGYVGYFFI